MTIRHLKTFITVVETGSVSKAAEKLCIAQPSVSQTIKELEHYYDAVLFNRVGKKLSITKDGLALLAKAKEVVNSFDDFESLASKNKISPTIYIGSTMTFGAISLPNIILELQKQIPNLDPRFYIDKMKGLEEKILNGTIDFAFSEGIVSSKLIKSIVFGEDRLVCVSGLQYPIPSSIKIEDLLHYDILLREEGSAPRKIIDEKLASKGIKVTNPRMTSVSNMIIISMVLYNQGVAILPYDLVKKYLQTGQLREITIENIELKRKLCVIYHKNKRFTATAKKALAISEQLLKEHLIASSEVESE